MVEETLDRQCDIQTKSDLISDSTKLVLNLAGKEGLASSEQEKLTAAMKAAFPENNIAQIGRAHV